jgi:hypothetical protein
MKQTLCLLQRSLMEMKTQQEQTFDELYIGIHKHPQRTEQWSADASPIQRSGIHVFSSAIAASAPAARTRH